MDIHETVANPATWVAVSFVIVVFGIYKKAGKLITGALDSRSAKIEAELAQARKLREEAEQVLALYKTKQAEYTKEAEGILKQARLDADNLAALADKELKRALDERMQHALQKIAQEEVSAINEVRQHVVDIALAAAHSIITQHVASIPKQDLLKTSLTDIEHKIH